MPFLKQADTIAAVPLVGHASAPALSVSEVLKHHRRTSNISGWRSWWRWRYELLAWSLIVLIFVALAVTLQQYQGMPIPEWPLGFTFNTLLAIYSNILKAPMLFLAAEGLSQLKWSWLEGTRPLNDLTVYDEASRGPWGAVKLIGSIRLRHISATIGALITILALGLDPFIQAAVSYDRCLLKSEAVSTVGRMNTFGSNSSRPASLDSPNTLLQLSSSVFDSELIKPPFYCPTDVCMYYDRYHSLGICSECEDLTSSIITVCNETSSIKQPSEYPACLHTLKFEDGSTENILTAGLNGYLREDSFVKGDWILWSSHVQNGITNEEPGLLYTISMVFTSPMVQKLAFRCKLKACTKTYWGRAFDQELDEVVQETNTNWGSCQNCSSFVSTSVNGSQLDRNIWAEALNSKWQIRVDCLPEDIKFHLITEKLINNDTVWSPWNVSWRSPNSLSKDTPLEYGIPRSCIFQYEWTDLGDSIGAFNGVLKGKQRILLRTTTGGTTPMLYPDSSKGGNGSTENLVPGSHQMFNNTSAEADNVMDFEDNGSVVLKALYYKGNLSLDDISSAMDNYTTALTNLWRRASTSASPEDAERLASELYPGRSNVDLQPAEGEVWNWLSCMLVHWQWLAMPGILVFASGIFLIMIIMENSAESELWRSSQVALLWHGLEGPAKEESSELESTKEMDRRAKKLTVKLRRVNGAWKLIQTT